MENVEWHRFFNEKFINLYGTELFDTIYSTIHDAINNDLDECILFQAEKTPLICVVNEKDYGAILEYCLGYYVSLENYEVCCDIKNHIDKHKQVPICVT